MGQVDYFKSLLKEAGLEKEAEEHLRALISEKKLLRRGGTGRRTEALSPTGSSISGASSSFGSVEVLKKPEALQIISQQSGQWSVWNGSMSF